MAIFLEEKMQLSDVIGHFKLYITEIENKFRASKLTFRHRAPVYNDRRFTTLQKMFL